jgi:hypothetical protein
VRLVAEVVVNEPSAGVAGGRIRGFAQQAAQYRPAWCESRTVRWSNGHGDSTL